MVEVRSPGHFLLAHGTVAVEQVPIVNAMVVVAASFLASLAASYWQQMQTWLRMKTWQLVELVEAEVVHHMVSMHLEQTACS